MDDLTARLAEELRNLVADDADVQASAIIARLGLDTLVDDLQAVQVLAERAQRNGEPLDPSSVLDIVGWPTQTLEGGCG